MILALLAGEAANRVKLRDEMAAGGPRGLAMVEAAIFGAAVLAGMVIWTWNMHQPTLPPACFT